MIENEVKIQGEYELSGTLTKPNETNEKFPAVLIIAGSGNGDRDGNLTKRKLHLNIYKDLAEFLTDKGLVTLRYDKRGTYKSKGNYLAAGVTDLIDDAAAAIQFLKNHPNVDEEKVLILGHSEGAIIGPAVHEKAPVSGLILLAGVAEPSRNLFPMQSGMALEEMKQARGLKGWLIQKLKVTEKLSKRNEKLFNKVSESDKDVMRVMGARINAKWFRETLNYNVCDYLENVTCPVLSITGDKDIQVPPEHAKKIAEMVQGEAEWHIIPNMNHILKNYEGEHTMLGIVKEYKSQMGQPIYKELLIKISNWLEKQDYIVGENNG